MTLTTTIIVKRSKSASRMSRGVCVGRNMLARGVGEVGDIGDRLAGVERVKITKVVEKTYKGVLRAIN